MSAVSSEVVPLIRPMLETDVPVVAAIENAVVEQGWTEGIFRDCLRVHYSCWVMHQGEELIGYAILSAAAGEAHILNIVITPERQGQGLGRRFMAFLLQVARSHGADTAFLEVRPSNRVAVHLYESIGFSQAGLRRDYYPTGRGREDALVMARSLEDIEA